jgi:DNA polymerase-1
MGRFFDTAKLDEAVMKELSSDEASWIYNGLDCCVTAEVYNALIEELRASEQRVQDTYAFALLKQAPIMEASLRGTLIDEGERQRTLAELSQKLSSLDAKFQRLCRGVFDTEINWRSPLQLKTMFYGSLGLKERRKRNAKGQYVATVNEEALEHFKVYLHARPFAAFILAMRELSKAIGFLKTEIDDDNRMRTSYNIAGTNTGRLSSRMSDFGTGTNVQNVDRSLRKPFVADPGMYLVNIDLEQADARNVGAILWNLFHDEKGPEYAGAYLDACESGDLHTRVCRMAWPDLAWPADPSEWKGYCDSIILFGQDSYRQVAKKLGHGTNYYGTPRTMAQHTKSPVNIIEGFQRAYFEAFPAIPAWHQWVIDELSRTSILYNLFGRRRIFFGRDTDATTHRQAIAYSPQSSTGEEIDRGWYQVWSHFGRDVQFLNQVHDSLLLQVPLHEANEIIPQILEVMRVDIELVGGRSFHVPLEAKAGWNWGNFDPKANPYGLKTWKGREDRERPSPRRRLKDYV